MSKQLPEFEPVFDAEGRNMLSSVHRFQHKKSGGTYVLLMLCRIESTLEPAVVYQNAYDTDLVWVRPVSEWTDGRFQIIG